MKYLLFLILTISCVAQPIQRNSANTLQKEGIHGVIYTYDRIDGMSSTALWRTTDGTLHFPNAPYLDGAGFLGNPLGVDPITGQLVPISAAAPVQNFFTANLFALTNYVDYFNSYSNAFITFNTNVTFTQNISVNGKATLQQIIITNSVKFATNAFPLAAGTTWDLSRYHQLIVTNADFNITALAGLSNNLVNLGELVVSNSAAGNIICHLQFAGNKIGPNTTNDVYIGSAKEAYISVETIATQRTNYVTAVEQ